MNGFNQQKRVGKTAEQAVKTHMINRGHKVIDVSENSNYQSIDTDFILCDGDQQISLEVKGDNNISKSGNFFFELDTEDEYGRKVKGWVDYTTADFLCFYDLKANKGYVLAWTALKDNLSTLGKEDYFFDRLDQKLTHSRLISIGTIRREGYLVYEWED